MNSNFQTGQASYDGTGITIGVISNSYDGISGYRNYRTLFGLPSRGIQAVYDGNSGNLSSVSDTEVLLDTEVAGGIAPGAQIALYAAPDTIFQPGILLAAYRAIEDNEVNILNLSFGACEADMGAAGNQEVLSLWQQAAAQGITVVVAAGDSGSAACDDPHTEVAASKGLAVNGLASTPYNIAVGGTDFDILPSAFSTYVSATNGSGYTSTHGYIPEMPWNDSTTTNNSLSGNVAAMNSGSTNIIAGGGGASSQGAVAANNILSGYPKPAWQVGYPLSNTYSVRDLPDVSLFAGDGLYRATWAFCSDNDCTGSSPTISGVGGTSASTPAFAGILALVNQRVGASTRLGQAAWVLYDLAQTSPTVFNQIAAGNNSVPCTAGSPNCGKNGFLTGYNASTGYNLATGLGSVDITQLVNHWQDDSRNSTQTSLSLDQAIFVHGTTVKITASVNPSAASGTIALVNNSGSQLGISTSSAPTLFPLTAGSASGSYSQLPGGSYSVFANYSGDGTYAGSTSSGVKVAVTPEDSVLNFSGYTINSNSQVVKLAGQMLPLGSMIVLSAQPVGKSEAQGGNAIADATGNVGFTDSPVYQALNAPIDSSGSAVLRTAAFGGGPHTLSATYNGDNSYNQSVSTVPVSFSIGKAPTSITVTSGASTINSGTVNIQAKLGTTLSASLLANPNLSAYGTVTFTDTTSNVVLGTASSNGEFCTSSSPPACYTAGIDVNVNQLSQGSNSIVASYSGNSNFEASGPSMPVAVTCTAGCSSGTGQTLQFAFYQLSSGTIAAGGKITATVSLTPGGNFTGAVNLTCSVSGKTAGDLNMPTCSFNPTQVQVATASQAVSSLITITTTAKTTASLDRPGRNRWLGEGSALAFLLFFGVPGFRKNRRALLSAVLLVSMIAWVAGCSGGGGTPSPSSSGGGGGGGGGNSGTTPDIYTVTFNAADVATNKVTAQDYFNFTVQ